MFDLDLAVVRWRNELAHEGTFTKSNLDELEDHLTSAYQSYVDGGRKPDLAFEFARDDVGAVAELSEEFGKVEEVTWRRFMVAGWLMYVASFFLPVHQYGSTVFENGMGELPGFEAFAAAIGGGSGFLGIVSALTNAAMGATLWKISQRDRNSILALAGIFTAAAFLNLWWISDGFAELRIGYYVWCGSFASVATGLIMRAKELTSKASPVATI